MSVAQTILEQLGGGKFLAMTGAKTLLNHGNGLSFRLPGNLTTDRINYCKITLTPADTYTVEFGVIRKNAYKVHSTHEDVYNTDLRTIFTATTGLDTSLGKIKVL